MNPYESPQPAKENIASYGMACIPGMKHLRVLRAIFCIHIAIVATSLAYAAIVVKPNPLNIRSVPVLADLSVNVLFAVAMVVAASVESSLAIDMRLRAVVLDVTFTMLHLWTLLVLLN